MKWRIIWSGVVAKQLDRIPDYLRDKFMAWVMLVERIGMVEARKLPGFNDEPLKGQRSGQRSIRLNKAYRAIYIEFENGEVQIVEVIRVSKHEY